MVGPEALTPRQEKHVLFTTAIVSGMGFADMLAVNTALPVMQADLGLDATSALWVAEIYLLFVASLMMMGGALGDRFGRRRILRYGVIAFAVSSLLCAASTTGSMLIFARATQGLAAALTLPSSLALLNASFPPERRGRAVGSWAAISSMMIPLGPLMGGAAVDYLSWHWIFAINLPFCAVALWFLRGVPKPIYGSTGTAPLDIIGLIGLTSGLGSLIYGLLEGGRHGFDDAYVITSLIAASIILPLTILYESRCRHPMLPLWMFRQRIFVLANLQTFTFFIGFQGTLFLLPFFHIQALGFSALQAGAVGLPVSIAMMILSRPVGRVMDKFGAGPLLATAPFIVAVALFWLSRVPVDAIFLRDIFPAVVTLAIGMGLYITPLTTVSLNAVGDDHTGLASAVNNTVARVAALIGVAVLGVLLAQGFADSLLDGVSTLGLNEAQLTAVSDQAQRLGTLIPPPDLTPDQAMHLDQLVRAAFTNGFQNAALAGSVFMTLTGLVGFFGLRKIGPKVRTSTAATKKD